MSNITGLVNNKRVLLAAGVLLVLFVGLWMSPRHEEFGPTRTGAAATPAIQGTILSEGGEAAVGSVSPLDLVGGYDRALLGAVGAFDCGSGNYVGAIEPGRAYKLVADLGDGRMQLDIKGSGTLCVNASELVR